MSQNYSWFLLFARLVAVLTLHSDLAMEMQINKGACVTDSWSQKWGPDRLVPLAGTWVVCTGQLPLKSLSSRSTDFCLAPKTFMTGGAVGSSPGLPRRAWSTLGSKSISFQATKLQVFPFQLLVLQNSSSRTARN